MSKVRDKQLVNDPYTDASSTPPPSPPPAPPPPPEKMREEDKLALDLARAKKDTALAQAKEAIAKNETAELSYKYVVLQLYMKYGLTAQDAISEQGDIIRGGAINAPKPQG